MRTRFAVAALLYMMVPGVLLGIGMVLVLTLAPPAREPVLIPWMIGLTVLVSLPIAWMLAPHLMLRFRRDRKAAATGLR